MDETCKFALHFTNTPYYRFSPPLNEGIALSETDPDKLVYMMITARAYVTQSEEFGKMIEQLYAIAEQHERVYK